MLKLFINELKVVQLIKVVNMSTSNSSPGHDKNFHQEVFPFFKKILRI